MNETNYKIGTAFDAGQGIKQPTLTWIEAETMKLNHFQSIWSIQWLLQYWNNKNGTYFSKFHKQLH